MSTEQRVGALFSELAESGSFETAFDRALRLLCETASCSAAGFATDDMPCGGETYWFRYDPHGLLDGAQCDIGAHRRLLEIPLECGQRSIGRVHLIAPGDADEPLLRSRIGACRTVLSVLAAALESSAAAPLSGLLRFQAFLARVASELSRSKRCGSEFAVLHIRLSTAEAAPGDERTNPWAVLMPLGEALAARLRESDAVGLMAPDRLAVLLATAGPLGARIAARRIEKLLPTLDDSPDRTLTARMELRVRGFPADGEDVARLCERGEQDCASLEPVFAGGRSE